MIQCWGIQFSMYYLHSSIFFYVLIGFVAFVPTERRYEQLDRVIVIVFETLVSIRQDFCKNYPIWLSRCWVIRIILVLGDGILWWIFVFYTIVSLSQFPLKPLNKLFWSRETYTSKRYFTSVMFLIMPLNLVARVGVNGITIFCSWANFTVE